ncbi:MAG: ABC-F family ATP-binding cassette domain-containing protein [Candidatus Sericytochromatia bacterium]|nr:ABC-F family ATP-binding cassette domain-containing protein [Candidatus Tanganyikabacteria bacterium]
MVIVLSRVAKYYGGRRILDAVDWRAGPGDRVGLIGANGAGKSTLLKLLCGREDADEGTVDVPRSTKVGYLAQEPPDLGDRKLHDVLWDALESIRALGKELAALGERMAATSPGPALDAMVEEQARLAERFEFGGGYEAEAQIGRVASGLGFRPGDLERPLSTFSGGWQMRAALGRLLLSRPDALLLDEPTNHLDLLAIEWLEGYLLGLESTVVVVSHDRRFLDRVCNRIAELDRGILTEWAGNYTAYLAARTARDAALESAAALQERELAKARAFIERFRASATKSTAAKSREKQVAKIERIVAPTRAPEVRFKFAAGPASARLVVRLTALSKAYGGRQVLSQFDLELERGMRVVLVGPNGSGKSTLLRVLAGTEGPDGGEIRFGQRVLAGYFAQHAADRLEPDLTVQEAAYRAAPDRWSLFEVRSLLAGFLFRGEDVSKVVTKLSGGERARLALAILLLEPHNLLLLDEPTNHLDMASKDVLADALAAFGGTVLLASHDRHVLDRVATHVLSLPDGIMAPGTYSDWRAAQDLAAEAAVPAPVARKAVSGNKAVVGNGAHAPVKMSAFKRARLLAEAEERIFELEDRKKSLAAMLADPAAYVVAHEGAVPPDPAAVVAEYATVETALATANAEWERLVEGMDG